MKFNRRFTALLWVILIGLILVLWALFISGPNRVHEAVVEQTEAKITKEVSGIQGITQHIFDYTTYQGYTDDTLYWFDTNGKKITTRKMSTLNYDAAEKEALDNYGIETKSIVLGYGYNNPCYVIEGEHSMILLDYDTLERVYQRDLQS